ncbi:hypothetical protein [Salimicrobium halophilum]|uniref:Transcription factor, RsfA family n=1 Tax=Salimicrobium halophilum TaxID=86666 RepID=A0A1G8QGE5_9BACI|nr:hypothetical protein [Salimicrobium halophilum]SDJ03787.1 transcription factor, RsfA family [Salimicrobium halophilum]
MIEIARKDAWKEKEDLILAETVLTCMKAGKTQLKAFEEASVKLKRTPRACGFRWNKVLRKKYDGSIREARQKSDSCTSPDTKELEKKMEVWERAWSDLEQFVRYVRQATK